MQVFSVALLISYWKPSRFHSFVEARWLSIAALLAFGAAVGTLYYSEVIGFIPCTLCWYQRFLLYPQLLLFIAVFIKKNIRIAPFITFFSSLGLLVAAYHISLPLWTSPIFCDPSSELCLMKYVDIFGFIGIPVMSGSVFLALLLLSLHGMRRSRRENAPAALAGA
jgi:disulfide bond formation protein DsbB